MKRIAISILLSLVLAGESHAGGLLIDAFAYETGEGPITAARAVKLNTGNAVKLNTGNDLLFNLPLTQFAAKLNTGNELKLNTGNDALLNRTDQTEPPAPTECGGNAAHLLEDGGIHLLENDGGCHLLEEQ